MRPTTPRFRGDRNKSAAAEPPAGVMLTPEVLRQLRQAAGLSIWTWNTASDQVTNLSAAEGGTAPAITSARDAL